MANKHTKRCLTSLASGKCKSESRESVHFTCTEMAKIKEKGNSHSVGCGHQNPHALMMGMHMVQRLWKIGCFLSKRLKQSWGGWVAQLVERLTLWFRLKSWSRGSWVRALHRALRWQHAACLGFCLPLSLPLPTLFLSLSLKINKHLGEKRLKQSCQWPSNSCPRYYPREQKTCVHIKLVTGLLTVAWLIIGKVEPTQMLD